jgi:enoyl-CoA hydratase/carnithine racemase
MSYETIRTDRDGSAFTITFNRPDKRNAISLKVMDELEHAVRRIDNERGVFGIIITGGEKFFSAGADLNDALQQMKTPGLGVAYMTRWRQLNSTLENASKPVIAAIEGFCMTGGFELTLACDLRVAGEGSSFAITSSKIGTVPGSGGTQRLPRIVGTANALEILFSGDPIDASHAFRIGLLNRLVPAGHAVAEAKKMIRGYEQRAPMSLKLLKRAVYTGAQMSLNDAIEFESFVVNTIYQTNDKQEGITAFLEKRTAVFKGD